MGNLREVGVETVVIDTTGGVAYGYCVKQAATAGHVAVGDATHAFAGVCRATQATTGGNVDIGTDGVLPMRAHEAIGRLTSGNPTAVYMAASGRVMLLPGTAGTYYRVGFVHVSSADAAAQDDILYVQIAPDIVVVPSSAFAGIDCIHFDLPADLADGASKEVFLFEVPTGLVFTINRFDIWNTDVGTGATVDPEISGTDIMASPQALTDNAQTEILAAALTDATVAAGENLSLEFATAATTGALAGCHGCVTGIWSAA